MAEHKLPPEEIDQFIDLYYNMKCLWDIRCKEYRDLNERNKAYSTISDILNISVETVKKKINNLRSTYNQEKKKVVASQKTGAGTQDIYEPTLPWFSKMRFLDDVIVPRKTVCSYENAELPHAPGSENKERESTIKNSETPKLAFSKKRRSVKNTTDAFDATLNSFKEVCAAESTEFDKFGESIASQLKNMPLKYALELQLELQETITKKRLKLLENENISNNGANVQNEYRPSSSLYDSSDTNELASPTHSAQFPFPPQCENVSEQHEFYSEDSNNTIFIAMRGAEIV